MLRRSLGFSANPLLRRSTISRNHSFVSIEKKGEMPLGNFRPKSRPDNAKFIGYDHLKYYCTSSMQAAGHLTSRLGFDYYAYSGPQTGNKDSTIHVVKKDDIVLSFESPNNPGNSPISEFVTKHGDQVKDISFEVEDCERIWKKAVEKGAISIKEPTESKDENGSVVTASIYGFGDVIHTLVERVSSALTSERLQRPLFARLYPSLERRTFQQAV